MCSSDLHSDRKCLVESGIDEYEANKAVCHAKNRHDLIDTNQKDYRSKHLGDDNDSQKNLFAFEFHSGKCIGCRNTTYDRDQSGAACNDQGVQKISGKRSKCPDILKVLPQPLDREKCSLRRIDF